MVAIADLDLEKTVVVKVAIMGVEVVGVLMRITGERIRRSIVPRSLQAWNAAEAPRTISRTSIIPYHASGLIRRVLFTFLGYRRIVSRWLF